MRLCQWIIVDRDVSAGLVVSRVAGVLSTSAGVVFGGDNEGNFMAFDSCTGRNLWHFQTGSSLWGGAPMTYMLDGRQYVVIGSGTTITAFALP